MVLKNLLLTFSGLVKCKKRRNYYTLNLMKKYTVGSVYISKWWFCWSTPTSPPPLCTPCIFLSAYAFVFLVCVIFICLYIFIYTCHFDVCMCVVLCTITLLRFQRHSAILSSLITAKMQTSAQNVQYRDIIGI